MSKFLHSEFFTVLSLILIGTLVFFIVKSKSVVKELTQEIQGLEDKIANVEKDTENLEEDLEYFKSDVYLERQARVKLNLKKPGETIAYIVREDRVASESEAEEEGGFFKKLFNSVFKRD